MRHGLWASGFAHRFTTARAGCHIGASKQSHYATKEIECNFPLKTFLIAGENTWARTCLVLLLLPYCYYKLEPNYNRGAIGTDTTEHRRAFCRRMSMFNANRRRDQDDDDTDDIHNIWRRRRRRSRPLDMMFCGALVAIGHQLRCHPSESRPQLLWRFTG